MATPVRMTRGGPCGHRGNSSAMYVLPIRFFGEPIISPTGANFRPGRVYSQRPDARRAGVMRLDHTTRSRGPHFVDAGSHKTFRHGIAVEELPIFCTYSRTPHPRPLSPQTGRGENVLG